ncbi:nitrogen regulation protein NR(II) [Geobacter sp. AOG2]|uniref:two-component system sensor histidine kinase NtrB n=1 Tax=Geobacter sp. AOG2 TaxID=1566347 RepID=UPI001CC783FF|nr:ATP-binding protein [Geobacter sp. AOG2]GFE61258.1 PAS domain-containing sensor histidine kinase [Geobacter sp. AOG2]
MGLERKLRLFIYARIVVSFLFLASTILLSYRDLTLADEHLQSGLIRLMAFSFLFSLCCLLFLRFRRFHSFIAYLQTIWDLLFVTVLLLFTNGILSPYSFLYLLSIMSAGLLLGGREALYTASLCTILYGSIADLQYFGLLSGIGLSQSDAQQLGATHIFYTIFLNLMGFYLTALITGFLSARARESEEALREKTVNYDELERLSTGIVSNLESGLLTITPTGRIRVFNHYAEMVTGMTQADAYNTLLVDVFPALAGITENMDARMDGEFDFPLKNGEQMTLGYNAVPFTDSQGVQAGAIVNFKDLTSMKRMEAALKRADRLAALGEISARMAHEIRNPLAAMSGSVQLLAEHGSISENDQRLLKIVLREAARLNGLITDFLAYARPSSPCKERFELRPLVDDMIMFLASDSHFGKVSFRNLVAAHILIQADVNQLRQVLLNLFRNAADAMPEGGIVEVESRFQLSGADGFHKVPAAVITVTDTGCGIDGATAAHLFEPFWTTKTDGSGLGLAVTYRIIEAHGGTVSVESPPGKGCRFTIMLPVTD